MIETLLTREELKVSYDIAYSKLNQENPCFNLLLAREVHDALISKMIRIDSERNGVSYAELLPVELSKYELEVAYDTAKSKKSKEDLCIDEIFAEEIQQSLFTKMKKIKEEKIEFGEPPPCWYIQYKNYGRVTLVKDEADLALLNGAIKVTEYSAKKFESPEKLKIDLGSEFLAALERNVLYGQEKLFDALLGKIQDLKTAYQNGGNIKEKALDTAACAYRIASHGDGGGNEKPDAVPECMALDKVLDHSTRDLIAGWVQVVDGELTVNFARDERDLKVFKHVFKVNENDGGYIEYHPVYKQQQSTKQKIDGWIQVIDGKQTQNFARNEEELELIKNMSKLYCQRGCTVEYIAVYRQLK